MIAFADLGLLDPTGSVALGHSLFRQANRGLQPVVTRPQDVTHHMTLAPAHQSQATEASVGSHDYRLTRQTWRSHKMLSFSTAVAFFAPSIRLRLR